MNRQSIAQIKELLTQVTSKDDLVLKELSLDDRKGVHNALKSTLSRLEKQSKLVTQFEEMKVFENLAREKGYMYIAGVDEVGRGPLAGPVVTAAVILPSNFKAYGLTDSKKLSKSQREQFHCQIKKEAIAYSVTFTDAEVIDEVNIYEATKQSMITSIQNLSVKPDYVLIDAMPLDIDIPNESFIKGDARSVSIAAASVLAKVERDVFMEQQAKIYPGYQFENNAGYGTKNHLIALEERGLTPLHRRSFEPIKSMIKNS